MLELSSEVILWVMVNSFLKNYSHENNNLCNLNREICVIKQKLAINLLILEAKGVYTHLLKYQSKILIIYPQRFFVFENIIS